MEYAVEIRPNRYIFWCDDCWYETKDYPNYFTKERAEEIVNQLKNHYVYKATLVGKDGERIQYPKVVAKANPMLTPKVEKKSIFKFKLK